MTDTDGPAAPGTHDTDPLAEESRTVRLERVEHPRDLYERHGLTKGDVE